MPTPLSWRSLPYFKNEAEKITADISGKNIVSAVKGLVPGDNMIITEWFCRNFGCNDRNMLVIGGPCHAEEVALDHLSLPHHRLSRHCEKP